MGIQIPQQQNVPLNIINREDNSLFLYRNHFAIGGLNTEKPCGLRGKEASWKSFSGEHNSSGMAYGKTHGGLIEDTREIVLGYGWSKKAKEEM